MLPQNSPQLRKRTPILHNSDYSSYNNHFNESESNEQLKEKVKKRIESFDIYPKTPKFIQKKTWIGAIISTITTIIITALFISELVQYFSIHRQDTLSVDIEKEGKIVIYFNVSFPSVKCFDLTIDSVDASGEAHINLHHEIHKVPIDSNGFITHTESRRTSNVFYFFNIFLNFYNN
jgi:hypothetical protein